MTVDWASILAEAEDSPRGLLAQMLAMADDLKNIVIVWEDSTGYTGTWSSADSRAQVIGLLAYAQFREMRDLERIAGD